MSDESVSPLKKQRRTNVSLLPPLEALPVSLININSRVCALLTQAALSLDKNDADAARESTFEYMESEEKDMVDNYTPVYAAAQLYYAQSCYMEARNEMTIISEADMKMSSTKDKIVENLDACLRAVDLAVLRTNVGEWTNAAKPLLQAAEGLRSQILLGHEISYEQNDKSRHSSATVSISAMNNISYPSIFLSDANNGSDIPRVDASNLSVEDFLSQYMTSSHGPSPVILCNAIKSWSALEKWKSTEYLKSKASGRLVPVETYDRKDSTQTYLTDTWERHVMPLGDFIDSFIDNLSMNHCNERGYLAQYQLFEQIPSLKDDIAVPIYCSAVTDEDKRAPPDSESTPPSSPLISAWFGPKGTVSPLHNDPYHNLLAQVVGRKYLRLYSAAITGDIYPREGPMCNNSYIDLDQVLENPEDSVKFPKFRTAKFQHCVLQPGELLYIPRHYWHYVRSLDKSFSTSFWWGAKMALVKINEGDSEKFSAIY